MKRYLIILFVLVNSVGFGQPDNRWVSGYEIVGNDTLLLDSLTGSGNADWVITYCADQLANIDNGYISAKSLCRLNGQPITTIFPVANFADTTFYEMLDHVLNSDSTEALPYRLNSISHYNTPVTGQDKTDLYEAFNVPFELTATMIDVCATCNYTSLWAANNAASDGDTIIMFDGQFNVVTYISLTNQGYVKAVGHAEIVNNASQTYTVFIDNDNITIDGWDINSNGSTENIYITDQDNCTVKNCYVSGHTTRGILLHGSGSGTTNYAINNVIDQASNNYPHIQPKNTSYYIDANYFYRGVRNRVIEDATTVSNTYFSKIRYNKVDRSFKGNSFYQHKHQNIDVSFNHFTFNRCFNILTDGLVTAQKNIIVNYNYFLSDSSYSERGFLKILDTILLYNVDVIGNTIYILDDTVNSAAIDITSPYSIDIKDNFIDMQKGLKGIAAQTVNNDSSTITISGNEVNLRKTENNAFGYAVFVNNAEGLLPDYNVIIENNILRNPFSFGHSNGGHAVIYFQNIKKARVWYNYLSGGEVTGMHFKGINGTTEGIECENTSFRYNIVDSTNILIKGCRNITIANNTVNSDFKEPLIIETNEDAAPHEDAAYNTVYNNIFYHTGSRTSMSLSLPADTIGFVSDNNILYSPGGFVYFTEFLSFNDYQAIGYYDQNSFNTDPLLNASLCPQIGSDAIEGGFNLGSPYNFGYNCSGEYVEQRIPWTIGARIVFKARSATYNNRVVVIGTGSNAKIVYF